MKAVAVIACPLWEDLAAGTRRPVLNDVLPDPGRCVGWVNVIEVEFAGERRQLLLGGEACR